MPDDVAVLGQRGALIGDIDVPDAVRIQLATIARRWARTRPGSGLYSGSSVTATLMPKDSINATASSSVRWVVSHSSGQSHSLMAATWSVAW
ncbi:hypothetical protein [Micromonospora echinospora]|uniref:hypothetical protein n=1 Tax=Micromonospora echinospora TaxID=1877 RepID=UPI003A8C1A5D